MKRISKINPPWEQHREHWEFCLEWREHPYQKNNKTKPLEINSINLLSLRIYGCGRGREKGKLDLMLGNKSKASTKGGDGLGQARINPWAVPGNTLGWCYPWKTLEQGYLWGFIPQLWAPVRVTETSQISPWDRESINPNPGDAPGQDFLHSQPESLTPSPLKCSLQFLKLKPCPGQDSAAPWGCGHCTGSCVRRD